MPCSNFSCTDSPIRKIQSTSVISNHPYLFLNPHFYPSVSKAFPSSSSLILILSLTCSIKTSLMTVRPQGTKQQTIFSFYFSNGCFNRARHPLPPTYDRLVSPLLHLVTPSPSLFGLPLCKQYKCSLLPGSCFSDLVRRAFSKVTIASSLTTDALSIWSSPVLCRAQSSLTQLLPGKSTHLLIRNLKRHRFKTKHVTCLIDYIYPLMFIQGMTPASLSHPVSHLRTSTS